MVDRILIVAGDSDGNLGDLAILTAICQQIRRIEPNARISVPTSRPSRVRDQLNISPLSRGWTGLVALAWTTWRADVVICGGGGLFQDDDSLLKMPYWALRLGLLRALNQRVCGLSIGAGPLEFPVSRFFARLALRALSTISVRDRDARAVLAPLTHKPVTVVPDPAFALESASARNARHALQEAGIPVDSKPLLGVAVRRWFHNNSNLIPYRLASRFGLRRQHGQRQMERFKALCAKALDEAIAITGAHVVFLPTYNVAHEDDSAVCNDIANTMVSPHHSIMMIDDPVLYQAVTGELATMLCGRMHPAILASNQSTPTIGIAYNQKFLGMYDFLDQRDQCILIDDFVDGNNPEWLIKKLVESTVARASYSVNTSDLKERTLSYIDEILEPERKELKQPRSESTQLGD